MKVGDLVEVSKKWRDSSLTGGNEMKGAWGDHERIVGIVTAVQPFSSQYAHQWVARYPADVLSTGASREWYTVHWLISPTSRMSRLLEMYFPQFERRDLKFAKVSKAA